jgi:hypothetical protein
MTNAENRRLVCVWNRAFESTAVVPSGHASMPQPGEAVAGGHAVVAVGYDDQNQWFLVRNSSSDAWAKPPASPSSRARKKALNQAQNGSPHDRTRIVITKVRGGFSESSPARRAPPTPPEFGWANSSSNWQAGSAPNGGQRFESQEAKPQNSRRLRLRFRCRCAHRIAWEHPA